MHLEMSLEKSKLSNDFGKILNDIANMCRSENIDKIVSEFIHSDFLIDSLINTSKQAKFSLKIDLTNYLNTTYDTLHNPCIYQSEDDKLIAEQIKQQANIKYGLHCDISDYEHRGETTIYLTFCFHDLMIK